MRNVLGIVLITATIAAASHYGFKLERAGTTGFWLLSIGACAAIALLECALAWRDGSLATLLRPVWGDFTRGVLGALVVFASAYAFSRWSAGTARESWLARLYLQLGDPTQLREHMLLFAVVIVIAASAEELVWRGLVTSLLVPLVGERWAWAAAAIPYALANVPTVFALRDPEAGYNPILVIAALGAGLVWGAMTRRFGGRLVPAIVAHAMFDWVVVFTFRLWGPSI